MRRGGLAAPLLALLICAGAAPAAQQPASPQQPQQPTFRAGVSLVTVDVRVVDNDGKPVPGLTKDDFVVTLDGQPRPVKALDYEVFGGSSATVAAPATGGTVTNDAAAAPTASRGGRVFLLVIDDLSASPLQMKGLLVSAEKMLDSLDPNDMVGLVTTSGLGPVISPMRDRAEMRTALRSKELAGRMDARLTNPLVFINEAYDIARPGGDSSTLGAVVARECGDSIGVAGRVGGSSRAAADLSPCGMKVLSTARQHATESEQRSADQIAAYIHAIEVLRQAPTPRTLIAITGGIGFHLGEAGALDPVSIAAAEANVTFQGLIAVDDADMAATTSPERAKAQRDEATFVVDGMQTIAYAAGGSATRVIGQADRFYNRIVTETSGVYHLGVDAPTDVKPSRYPSLKVSVKKSGVSVHTNAHAIETNAPVEVVPVATQLKQRVEQGGTAFGVPLAVTTARRRDATSPKVQILVNVSVPSTVIGPLNEIFAVVNTSGHVVQSGARDLPGTAGQDYQLTFAVPVDAGEYKLRVAVADAKGTIGSVEQPVSAQLTRVGPLLLSDLVLTAIDPEGGPHLLPKDTVPPGTRALQAVLECYPDASAPPSLSGHVTVAPVDGGKPLVDDDVEPTTKDGRVLVSARFSAASIPAGTYLVTASVTTGGKTIGSATAKLHKVE